MRQTLPFSKKQIYSWCESIPTPFYIYDENGISDNVINLYKAFSWNKGFREYFAVKATPTPAILRLLNSLGCGADCASISELTLAQKSGMRGKIIFSANEVRPGEYREALKAGAIINFDDITQIERFESACGTLPSVACCRYNPGEFRDTNRIMGHLFDSKFGMTKEQLFAAFSLLKEKGVSHFGLHAMLASCSLDNGYYPALATELFQLAVEIQNKLGISLEFIDLSGGIGIPYRPEEIPVDIFSIGDGVKQVYNKILTANGLEPSLFTEMGRYITGPYGYLVASVIGKKNIYKKYIGIDATACDLMRPAMYGAYHHISVPGKENEPCENTVDVVGSLCENNDKFAVDRPLPNLDYGDIIVIQDCGAHGHSMGYNYNGKLRCAEYMLTKDSELKMIRRSESVRDLFATLDVDEDFSGNNIE